MSKELAAMKTLLNLEPPSLYTTISPQRNPIGLHSKRIVKQYPDLHLKSWKLHAEAKGFNRSPAPSNSPQKKDIERKIPQKNNSNDDDEEEIPAAVWNRMAGRILFYVGVPLVSGLVLLQIFSLIKEKKLLDLPKWVPYLTTFITFGASTMGIVYGTLSTSWDPDKEGSLLGFENVQRNWVDMWNEEDGSSS